MITRNYKRLGAQKGHRAIESDIRYTVNSGKTGDTING